MSRIDGRLGLQQRVLASYRAALFDALALECAGGMSLFAGQPRPGEMIEIGTHPRHASLAPARNRHFFNGPLFFCWQSGWKRWLSDFQPDVLIVEANPRYLHVPAMARWMRRHSRPVIGWGLGAPGKPGGDSWVRKVSRENFLANFDALITYSHQGAAEYAALGVDPRSVFVAPNAVAPRPAWPFPERPSGFAGRPVILFVGRLQARKRGDLLLQACAALPAALQPELWIVGDGPEKASLERMAGQVYPPARFFGKRFGAELQPFFMKADLFVLPGTGGLAIQEAMSCGLPVAVAEADGTQADLVRSENGWILPSGDLDALEKVYLQKMK